MTLNRVSVSNPLTRAHIFSCYKSS